MKKFIFGGAIAALAFAPLLSHGFQIQKNDDIGFGSVLTAKGNRYIGGGNLSIGDATLGDLFAGGGSVTVTASTSGDLIAAGGNVTVSGPVGDDARVAGGNVTISDSIGGDLLVAGGQVRVEGGSRIGGEAAFSGGVVVIEGIIAGDVMITADNVVVNGVLESDADIRAGSLTFGGSSVVRGNVKFVGRKEAVVEQGAQVGAIDFTRSAGREERRRELFSFGSWIFKFLVMLAASLVLYFVFERRDERKFNAHGFGLDVVRGIVLLATIPIAAIILFITLIGSWLGLAGLALYVLFILLAVGYVGILAGRLLSEFVLKRKFDWKSVVLGVLSVEIAMLIPFVGWVACFVLFLASFGWLFKRLYLTVKG